MRKIIASYKKITNSLKPYNNERGFIMGVVILLSLILLVIVTMAIWSTSNESQIVRNNGLMTQEFYDAESGIVGAINHSGLWMTPEFMATAPDTNPSNQPYVIMEVYKQGDVFIRDSRPTFADNGARPSAADLPTNPQVAEVQIRHIDRWEETSPGNFAPVKIKDQHNNFLWDQTNNYPDMQHVGAPSDGSPATMRGHYFAITSRDVNNNSTVQVGVIQDAIGGP